MASQQLAQKEYNFKWVSKPDLRFWTTGLSLIWLIFLLLMISSFFLTIHQLAFELLILLLISLFLTTRSGLLTTRPAAQRIDRITNAAERVAQGDLMIQIDDEGDDEIGRLVGAFNQMVANLEHLHHSRDLLSRTVSPAVRQSLIEKGLDFRGIVQTVSVLFIDIRGFTRITEIYNTEQLVFFLNDYYTTIANQVHIGGGIIGKYGGDSILAYFGALEPEPPSKSTLSALLTALALQDAIELINERWGVLGLPPIRVGVGISIGPVVAGPVGSEEQFEYTVIGDAVNLAYRLQDLTRNVSEYGTIVSAEVYEALEDKIKDQMRVVSMKYYESLSHQEKARQPAQFVDLGQVLVKGKKSPVRVYGIPDLS